MNNITPDLVTTPYHQPIPATTGDMVASTFTPAVAAPALLEHSLSTTGSAVTVELSHYYISTCSCKSWFCPDCTDKVAQRERQRLHPVIDKFSNIRMLHLTLQPDLFDDPCSIYEYLADNRCVARLMRKLRKTGTLTTPAHFARMEFQADTGLPHFHILVDALDVSEELLQGLWDSFRPPGLPAPAPRMPGLGWATVTSLWKPHTHDEAVDSAVNYVTKPINFATLPSWVLDKGGANGKVPVVATSRGFWPPKPAKPTGPGTKPTRRRTTSTPTQRTYGDVVDACGSKRSLFQAIDHVDLLTGEVSTTRLWFADLETAEAGPDDLRAIQRRTSVSGAPSALEALTSLQGQCDQPIRIRRSSARLQAEIPELFATYSEQPLFSMDFPQLQPPGPGNEDTNYDA